MLLVFSMLLEFFCYFIYIFVHVYIFCKIKKSASTTTLHSFWAKNIHTYIYFFLNLYDFWFWTLRDIYLFCFIFFSKNNWSAASSTTFSIFFKKYFLRLYFLIINIYKILIKKRKQQTPQSRLPVLELCPIFVQGYTGRSPSWMSPLM